MYKLFNGYKVKLYGVDIEDLTPYSPKHPSAEMDIFIAFYDEEDNLQRMKTKDINKVKVAEGFKEHVLSLVKKGLEYNKEELNRLLKDINNTERELSTWYHAGKLNIQLNVSYDIPTMEEDISKLLDEFIKSKYTKSHYDVS